MQRLSTIQLRHHHEAVQVRALNSEDALDEQEPLALQRLNPVPILNVGRVHVHVQQEDRACRRGLASRPACFRLWT